MKSPPSLLRYGSLAVPLAFAGLPIYLHIPHLYTTVYHLPLAMVGLILLCLRLADALVDPLIGLLSDRTRFTRKQIIMAAAIPLTAGFVGVFNPPSWMMMNPTMLAWWLTGTLLLVYIGFSVVMINYYASGMSYGEKAQTRVSAFRETGILLGVILASVLPTALIAQMELPEGQAYRAFSFVFPPLLILCLWITHSTLSRSLVEREISPSVRDALHILTIPAIRQMLVLFLFNALPSAITSTLFLFFVDDVLESSQHAGGFLLVYFVFAALSIPLWVWLSKRYGQVITLALGMLLAIISFVWAYSLTSGDITAFYVICAVSGIAMGADVTLLPVLFAYALRPYPAHHAFAYSLWHVLSKLTLALAAGVVLPMLAWVAYQPDQHISNADGIDALAVAYAIVPCALKMIALLLLLKFFSKSISHKECS